MVDSFEIKAWGFDKIWCFTLLQKDKMILGSNLSSVLGGCLHQGLSFPLRFAALLGLWFLLSYAKLRHVPGPFLASLINFPRLCWVLSNRAHDIHTSHHRNYGKFVRFRSNMPSVGDPAEIPNVYGFNDKFVKVRRISPRFLQWQRGWVLTSLSV